MPRGDYREGRTAELQKNLVSSDQDAAPSFSTRPSVGSTSTSYVKVSPANPSSATAIQSVLPDLGGEPDAVAPVTKPIDPTQQMYRGNAQAGSSPSGMPSGTPSSNGSQGVGGNNFVMGPNNSPSQGATPSVSLGGAGLGANISPTATNFHYESKSYLAHVGLDYTTPQSNFGFGVKADGAALVAKTVALGSNLTLNNNFKEAVLSGVWMPEDTHLKAKLSASYMWGQQNFAFYSGNSNATLSQASYYFSTQYVVPKVQSDYLHSVGVSTWGSKASQTNNPDPIYSVASTPTAYQIMMDPLKLAVGTLQGEALDAQVGISKQVIAKVSAGYESLKFPFSDGTQELNKRIYQDYVVQYQPVESVTLQAGYKMGAALNNIMLSAAYSQWKLTGFKNNGVNGITGSQGLMLAYSFPLDGVIKSASFGALVRPELVGNSSYILRDAATRPVQLPQAFLAKVDTTAVKMIASISKVGLPSGVTTNAAGDALITIGAGAFAITKITRNGVVYSGGSLIQLSGQVIQIRTRLLPVAAPGGDTFVIYANDLSTPAVPYLVNITTAN